MPAYPNRLGDPLFDEARYPTHDLARLSPAMLARIGALAGALIERARSADTGHWFDIQSFLAAFPISEPAGVGLLRLAEALPRTSDEPNQIALLADKLEAIVSAGRNEQQAGRAAWLGRGARAALTVADQMLPSAAQAARGDAHANPLADYLVRPAVRSTVAALGSQFVFGEAIGQALNLARRARAQRQAEIDGPLRYSFDMLGEGARTWADADVNLERYREALAAVAQQAAPGAGLRNDGLSIKVSAIHPRYELTHYPREKARLLELLLPLFRAAAQADVNLTIDAEESERLELHLDLFAELAQHRSLNDWPGLGLVIQGYQLRAQAAIATVIELARARRAAGGAPIALRLVKGAYWDAEIKRAQELGLAGYPVFTHKGFTDRNYLSCAALLLDHASDVYPQFATHNAVTVAAILELARSKSVGIDRFELQRLHGMGESVYRALSKALNKGDTAVPACRVYAPVGDQSQLLAYLIRRMLENGASTSFVRRLADVHYPVERLVTEELDALTEAAAPLRLPRPPDLFGAQRRAARGFDVLDSGTLARFERALTDPGTLSKASPKASMKPSPANAPLATIAAPADRSRVLGTVAETTATQAAGQVDLALRHFDAWTRRPVGERAGLLRAWADAIEADIDALAAWCVNEAGKTLADAIADVREAVDFCRYYAYEAERLMAQPHALPGPTGEQNELRLAGRGLIVCISPWNFPVAIFVGQVAAALVTGNCVIAKPAEQTPLTALRVAQLAHRIGVPREVLQVATGRGEVTGAALVGDPRIAGVVFTGSNATAKAIQRTLIERNPAIVPLIAETGGQNAMIVDSTALLEQVADSVVQSAFRSAGQRCSALRVLFVQHEVADALLAMIRGAMSTLVVGDPADAATDVGPVIDEAARASLQGHIDAARASSSITGRPVFDVPLPATCRAGSFVAPTLIELVDVAELAQEWFGPILHVVRYSIDTLDDVIDSINATGFGLTLGVHTRIDARAAYIASRARVGNVYVNRNMIGAVVGVQPFGGEGLSGTGPKAGGPFYLQRLVVERTCTINTAAAGGNLALLNTPL